MEGGLSAEGDKFGRADALAGDIDAPFEGAYLRFRDPLFHYVRRFAVDDDEAADLTARTFERALVKLSSHRGERHDLGAWLFRIARSQGIDATRRRRPLRTLELIKAEQHPFSEQGEPELELLRHEASRELAEHVHQLPPLQRECLALRYGAGLSAREIGVVVGKSEAATQKMISRALDRLRETYS
jgi:RNA polymerase sigma factor (sigma-70 family)